jgi:DNA adenine methylase
MYKNIQTNVLELIQEIKLIEVDYYGNPSEREEYYYKIRDKYNELTEHEYMSPKGSAMFLFLNKTCFGGIYRERVNGIFTTPYGHGKKMPIFNDDNLTNISELVKDVIFTHDTYEKVFELAREGDFIYINPPHVQCETERFSYMPYYSRGISPLYHETLFESISTLKERGIICVMSNSQAKIVLDTFTEPTYNVKRIEYKRTIKSKDPIHIIGHEVLVRN